MDISAGHAIARPLFQLTPVRGAGLNAVLDLEMSGISGGTPESFTDKAMLPERKVEAFLDHTAKRLVSFRHGNAECANLTQDRPDGDNGPAVLPWPR
jgi:hypothetical protein